MLPEILQGAPVSDSKGGPPPAGPPLHDFLASTVIRLARWYPVSDRPSATCDDAIFFIFPP